MSKKKVQHKGKPKHATEEAGSFQFRSTKPENEDEEYTTVVEYESNKKYSKRPLESNWAKYESTLENFESGDHEDSPKTDDFSYLLKTASSDCSHFEFNEEKLWRSDDNAVPTNEIFNIDLNVLAGGLACVPFYERVGLAESDLSVEDKERLDEAATKAWEVFKPIKENFMKKFQIENDSSKSSMDDDENTKDSSLEDVIEAAVNLNVNASNAEQVEDESNEASLMEVSKTNNEVNEEIGSNLSEAENVEAAPEKSQRTFFSNNDENLEDWLDSVLDD